MKKSETIKDVINLVGQILWFMVCLIVIVFGTTTMYVRHKLTGKKDE